MGIININTSYIYADSTARGYFDTRKDFITYNTGTGVYLINGFAVDACVLGFRCNWGLKHGTTVITPANSVCDAVAGLNAHQQYVEVSHNAPDDFPNDSAQLRMNPNRIIFRRSNPRKVIFDTNYPMMYLLHEYTGSFDTVATFGFSRVINETVIAQDNLYKNDNTYVLTLIRWSANNPDLFICGTKLEGAATGTFKTPPYISLDVNTWTCVNGSCLLGQIPSSFGIRAVSAFTLEMDRTTGELKIKAYGMSTSQTAYGVTYRGINYSRTIDYKIWVVAV